MHSSRHAGRSHGQQVAQRLHAGQSLGVALGDAGLPVAFDRAHGDRYHKLDEKTGGLAAAGPIAYREGVQLTGESKRIDGALYWEARDGRWVRDSQRLVKIDPPKEWPQFAPLSQNRW